MKFDASRSRSEISALHEERIDAVCGVLLGSDIRSVIDLGCGTGSLIVELLTRGGFDTLLGVDSSMESLMIARERLTAAEPEVHARWALEHASLMEPRSEWTAFDAATLVETIEHIPPAELSRLERVLFSSLRPEVAVMTTPNREYNARLGLSGDEMRHRDHRFEWSRSKFRTWSAGVAARNGYTVTVEDIGRADPLLGSASQMAVFHLAPSR